MDISFLDFFLVNILSYMAGVGTGLVICCKNKDKLFGRLERTERELEVTQPYSPPPQADVIATAPLADQVNKGLRITLE